MKKKTPSQTGQHASNGKVSEEVLQILPSISIKEPPAPVVLDLPSCIVLEDSSDGIETEFREERSNEEEIRSTVPSLKEDNDELREVDVIDKTHAVEEEVFHPPEELAVDEMVVVDEMVPLDVVTVAAGHEHIGLEDDEEDREAYIQYLRKRRRTRECREQQRREIKRREDDRREIKRREIKRREIERLREEERRSTNDYKRKGYTHHESDSESDDSMTLDSDSSQSFDDHCFGGPDVRLCGMTI